MNNLPFVNDIANDYARNLEHSFYKTCPQCGRKNYGRELIEWIERFGECLYCEDLKMEYLGESDGSFENAEDNL